jgi:hypothetical protein
MVRGMQGHGRRLIPAVTAALVHAAILAGVLSLRPKAQPASPDNVLPIFWLERKPALLPPVAAPGEGLSLRAPSLSIAPPDLPITTAPANELPSLLGAYVACGLPQAATADERKRCEEMAMELYGRSGVAASSGYDLVLEQRFSREKAVQGLPLLRVCFRRMGPDPVCFTRGYEVLYGSTAARDSVPILLADPLRPR